MITLDQLIEAKTSPQTPAFNTRTLDVAALVSYHTPLEGPEQRVLEAFIATAQLYVDWFGDPRILFTPWFGEEIWGIPQTTVKRGLHGLERKGYIKRVAKKLTYRTAPRNGREAVVWDLVVSHPLGERESKAAPLLDQVVYWSMRGYTSDAAELVAQKPGNVRMTLWDCMRYLIARGECKYLKREKKETYFRSFGPIDAHSRQLDLHRRRELMYLVEVPVDLGRPPPLLGQIPEDVQARFLSPFPKVIPPDVDTVEKIEAYWRANVKHGRLGKLQKGYWPERKDQISQEDRMRISRENAGRDEFNYTAEFIKMLPWDRRIQVWSVQKRNRLAWEKELVQELEEDEDGIARWDPDPYVSDDLPV